MKKLLLALAFMLVPALAFAGWNIQQRSDGTTVWINPDGETVPVGAVLNYTITDVSTAGTHVVPIPVDGKVKIIYSGLGAPITSGDAVLDFSTTTSATTVMTNFRSGSATNITIANSGSATGTVDSMTPTSALTVYAGGVLAVHTNGGSSGTVPVTLTIVIEGQ